MIRFALVVPVVLAATSLSAQVFKETDYGPHLNWTYEVDDDHIAYKAIAVRVDEGEGGLSKGRAWMVFDHDTLLMSAAWTGEGGKKNFINWKGVAFDGSHNSHPEISGERVFVNRPGPGFAGPSGTFDDPRFKSRVDKKFYGPIPRAWGHFKGIYRHGRRVVLSYTVGKTPVLEMPGLETAGDLQVFTRTFSISKSAGALVMRVAPDDAAVMVAGNAAVKLEKRNDETLLRIPAVRGSKPLRFKVLIADADEDELKEAAGKTRAVEDITALTKGGPAQWKERFTTKIEKGQGGGGFDVDILRLPDNPYSSWMRLGGFDFFKDGRRAAVCTWNGDVWIVSGIDGGTGATLTWQRITTGLFQPLGVKVVDGEIYVGCRDMIAHLVDLNGDGETDFIRSFNNDHQVTEHFHEFAMGLQTDKEGNFYYAKSARHAKVALVPHHGTLIKVSRDGEKTEIIASGFRAANGVCVNDDGTWFVTDQEGHWTPKNRINLVRKGGFYGNMMGWVAEGQSDKDSAMSPPVVWITNKFDRSPAELVRVDSKAWGPLNGAMLNLSYGTGRIYLVPFETVGKVAQGGVVSLPLQFPTGIMRGRFHPKGDLYACGLVGWSSSQRKPGGFYRVRRTGKVHYPVGLKATARGMVVTFTEPLDRETATDPDNYGVRTWNLLRSKRYGSKHIDEKTREISGIELMKDGKSVLIKVEGIGPTWGMSIRYRIKAADGTPINQEIHNTIHVVGR